MVEIETPPGQLMVGSVETPWLVELNRLREIGGLKPVKDDEQLSQDCAAHAKYLIDQGPGDRQEFIAYRVKLGLGAHEEDPRSDHYTAAGAECVDPKNLPPGFSQSNDVAWGRNSTNDLDGLFFDAPFHRLSLLASWATMAGYGENGTWPRRVGVLSLKGEGGIGSPLIRFPAEGTRVPVGGASSFEIPNPLSACPGYQLPSGLPITIQLGSGYRGRLASYSLRGPSGPIETCGFDWLSYENPDPNVQEHARKVLRAFGALVLVPRLPLADGQYIVSVDTVRQKFEWSFTVANERPDKRDARDGS